MPIKVCYFASLKEQIGRSEEAIESPATEHFTAAELWMASTGQTKLPDNILIARNHEYIDAGEIVRDGDEIAFFPPVTGG